MDKKKVVQIVRSPAGGIRKHIISIISNLDDDFEFILITNEADGDREYINFKSSSNIRIYNIPMVDQPGLKDLIYLFKIYKILLKVNPDIVHGHGAKGGLYSRICGWLVGAKTIYTAHGGAIHDMHGTYKNILYSIIEKLLYIFTDILIFESKYTMNTYAKKVLPVNEKYFLNYNGVDLPVDFYEYEHKLIQEPVFLGAFGLLRFIKGHDILIKAAKELRDRGYNIEVKIFGTGEEREALLKLAKDIGISKYIKICEFCDNALEEMRNCHVIVHPSRFESFGYVPIEALSMGVPVVTSLVGGLIEISDYGKRFHTFEVDNVGQLCRAIESTLSNNFEFKNDFIKEYFSEESFVRNIKSIYLKPFYN